MNLDLARSVADAVLYEGYLLYPYRASSTKNQARWQFGVLGPPGAAEAGLGEASSMTLQCLVTAPSDRGPERSVRVHLRFLQLQRRQAYDGRGTPVDELLVGGATWTSWDEAVEREVVVVAALDPGPAGRTVSPVHVDGAEQVEPLGPDDGGRAGHVVRRTWPVEAEVTTSVVPRGAFSRLEIAVRNTRPDPARDKDDAIRTSLIGAHLLVEATGFGFVSLTDPPPEAAEAARDCRQDRCWPVLAGTPGETDLLLGSPIILYDYPQIATQSAGSLFDATEIDEILTLRVMTMTDEEKAEARATDPRAREIIDRCDQMAPETLQQMHGILRNPHAGEPLEPGPRWPGPPVEPAPPSFDTGTTPWWDPQADESVRPGTDTVLIDGVGVSRGSLVRVHPTRCADAQDLFFAGQVARVTAVVFDVDGGVHVGLVLVDDPATEMHDWYGRYFYFAPDEVTPLSADETRRLQPAQREPAQREPAQQEPAQREPAQQEPAQREESRP